MVGEIETITQWQGFQLVDVSLCDFRLLRVTLDDGSGRTRRLQPHASYELVLSPFVQDLTLHPPDYYPAELSERHWYGRLVACHWQPPISRFRVANNYFLRALRRSGWHLVAVPPYGHLLIDAQDFRQASLPATLGHIVMWTHREIELMAYGDI